MIPGAYAAGQVAGPCYRIIAERNSCASDLATDGRRGDQLQIALASQLAAIILRSAAPVASHKRASHV